jgi:hypothetical protein
MEFSVMKIRLICMLIILKNLLNNHSWQYNIIKEHLVLV